jgi:hypothetical protein
MAYRDVRSCRVHALTPAAARCGVCRAALCDGCVRYDGTAARCERCLARERRTARHWRAAVIALALLDAALAAAWLVVAQPTRVLGAARWAARDQPSARWDEAERRARVDELRADFDRWQEAQTWRWCRDVPSPRQGAMRGYFWALLQGYDARWEAHAIKWSVPSREGCEGPSVRLIWID